LIVGDDVGPLVRLGQVIENDDRDLLEFQFSDGEQAPVPRDDARLGIDKNRIVEAELSDEPSRTFVSGSSSRSFALNGLL